MNKLFNIVICCIVLFFVGCEGDGGGWCGKKCSYIFCNKDCDVIDTSSSSHSYHRCWEHMYE